MYLCKCGCSQAVKKSYAQGHNAKRGVGGDIKYRLLSKIKVHPSSHCWEWISGTDKKGYGEIRLKNGKSGGKRAHAHRMAYEVFVGKIPQGMLVCHICDNPKCINPEHLFLGAYKDNYRDSKEKGRNAKGEKNGQAILTEEQAGFIKYRSQGLSLKELGEQFGVCIGAISKIRCGHNWAWL